MSPGAELPLPPTQQQGFLKYSDTEDISALVLGEIFIYSLSFGSSAGAI